MILARKARQAVHGASELLMCSRFAWLAYYLVGVTVIECAFLSWGAFATRLSMGGQVLVFPTRWTGKAEGCPRITYEPVRAVFAVPLANVLTDSVAVVAIELARCAILAVHRTFYVFCIAPCGADAAFLSLRWRELACAARFALVGKLVFIFVGPIVEDVATCGAEVTNSVGEFMSCLKLSSTADGARARGIDKSFPPCAVLALVPAHVFTGTESMINNIRPF